MMKKRLLAMLLCIVMVLAVIPTAVFPIFAVEGEEVEGGGEAEAPKTYTYKDLYVKGADFAWDAFDKTEESAFPEDGILFQDADKGLKVLVEKTGGGAATVAYGDGYLKLYGEYKITFVNVYAQTKPTADATVDFTTEYTYANADEISGTLVDSAAIALKGGALPTWKSGAARFTVKKNFDSAFNTDYAKFKIEKVVGLDSQKLWRAAYNAAAADEALQATWYGADNILANDYDYLVALEATDEVEAGTYAYTAEEALTSPVGYTIPVGTKMATFAGFAKLIDASYANAAYYVTNTTETDTSTADNMFLSDIGWKSSIIQDFGNHTWNSNTTATNRIFGSYGFGVASTITAWSVHNAVVTGEGEEAVTTYQAKMGKGTIMESIAVNGATRSGGWAHGASAWVPVTMNSDLRAHSFAQNLYSVRVYPTQLSAVQLAQNHFADLCGYLGMESETIETYLGLSEEVRNNIAMQYTAVDFSTADKEDILVKIAGGAEMEAAFALAEARRALYVDGATFMWDAYDVAEGDADFSAFLNLKDGADLAASGTAGNKFVRSTSQLSLGGFIPTYTPEGSSMLLSEDVTIEIVLHQHWDDEIAASFDKTAGKQHFAWGNTLVRRYAEANQEKVGALEWRTQDPTNENNEYPGFIKLAQMTSYAPDGSAAMGTKPTNFNTDGGDQSIGVFYANELNEPYTIAFSFDFNCEHEFPHFKLSLARDTVTLGAMISKYYAATTAQTFTLFDGSMPFGYYAIRAYNKVLEEEEMQQNHFADLVGYAGASLETIEAFNALEAEAKTALYAKFATTELKDITEDAIVTAIEGIGEEIAAARKEAVQTAADALFTWGGIKAKLYGNAGLRVYASVGELTAEGMTLVDSGVMIDLAGADLVVRYDEETDSYVTNAGEIDAELGYSEQIFGKVSDEVTFATKEFYEMEFAVRGYAVIEYLGETYICYTDLASEAFGASFSMYEIAQHESLADSAACQAVIAACTTPEA